MFGSIASVALAMSYFLPLHKGARDAVFVLLDKPAERIGFEVMPGAIRFSRELRDIPPIYGPLNHQAILLNSRTAQVQEMNHAKYVGWRKQFDSQITWNGLGFYFFRGPAINDLDVVRKTGDWLIIAANGWALAAMFAILPAMRWLWPRAKKHEPRNGMTAGCCPQCGYDLRATPNRWSECGTRCEDSNTKSFSHCKLNGGQPRNSLSVPAPRRSVLQCRDVSKAKSGPKAKTINLDGDWKQTIDKSMQTAKPAKG